MRKRKKWGIWGYLSRTNRLRKQGSSIGVGSIEKGLRRRGAGVVGAALDA